MIYYVYQYLRADSTPYYIGKGKKKRAWKHSASDRIQTPVDLSRIQIVAHKLTEFEAHLLETRLISLYGRKDLGTGILRNMTDGGDGLSNPSVITRMALSVAKLGKKDSDETKRKKSESMKGIKKSARTVDHSRKISESEKGSVPWNKGVKTPGVGGVKKGNIPWNKGMCGQSQTEEYKIQQSIRMAEWWKNRKEQKYV